MKSISLNGTWQLRGREQDVPNAQALSLTATVPGCVQLDLSEQGYLPRDLFMGSNILEAERFESYEWWYERAFLAPEERSNVYLVFEGVDCLAEYFLNGVKLGESNNMFIAHEFRIDEYLRDGENTLTVHLRSAIIEAQDKDYPLKLLSINMNPEARYLRKAPHSYGWDIMPRAVTAGLWREVRLEVRDEIYPTQLFVHPYRDVMRFYYTLDCDWRTLTDARIEISGSCGEDSTFYASHPCPQKFGNFSFQIDQPKLWFPYGYGDPNVYDGTLRIYRGDTLVHEESFSFGIRTVELDRENALNGMAGQFRILVNGVEILCKGSNWVPLDAFHCRDAQRYDQALALVKDIGCNILRCWGGNVYEDHAFFDFCDRNGIMVWQDFAMACAFYPETEEFKRMLAEEATAVIRKLRNHPSIVIWAGDNEVDACNRLHDPNANTLTREVLAKCVDLNDIGRPYLPSSPYISPEEHAAGAQSQRIGSILVEDHLWGPRDYFKSEFYKENQAHFVSETGYHGCPSMESIRKFITPKRVWPYQNNPEWILHSSDQAGNDSRMMLMEKQIRQLFGEVPTDPEEFSLASQISQAEAKKYFIERIRVGRPKKTGIIWWNLLDGWPQMSDAVVDYYFQKKLAYFYIKRSQAPFVIAADEPRNWGLPIYACNDTLHPRRGHLTVKDIETDEILHETDFSVGENTCAQIATVRFYHSERRMLLFLWEANGERGVNHYLCGYPPFSLANYRDCLKRLLPDES